MGVLDIHGGSTFLIQVPALDSEILRHAATFRVRFFRFILSNDLIPKTRWVMEEVTYIGCLYLHLLSMSQHCQHLQQQRFGSVSIQWSYHLAIFNLLCLFQFENSWFQRRHICAAEYLEKVKSAELKLRSWTKWSSGWSVFNVFNSTYSRAIMRNECVTSTHSTLL